MTSRKKVASKKGPAIQPSNPYSIVAISLAWIIIWSLGISLGRWFEGLSNFFEANYSLDAGSITTWIYATPFIIGGFGLGYANAILRKDKNILASTITGGIVCSAIAFGSFITVGMIVFALQN